MKRESGIFATELINWCLSMNKEMQRINEQVFKKVYVESNTEIGLLRHLNRMGIHLDDMDEILELSRALAKSTCRRYITEIDGVVDKSVPLLKPCYVRDS